VIVGNLDIERVGAFPTKADPPLIVDPDAVLTLSVFEQLFESIAGWYPEVFHRVCRIENQEFSKRDALDTVRELPRSGPAKDLLRLRISEAPNHDSILTPHVINVKRYYVSLTVSS
jgi:hypothetical protein